MQKNGNKCKGDGQYAAGGCKKCNGGERTHHIQQYKTSGRGENMPLHCKILFATLEYGMFWHT